MEDWWRFVAALPRGTVAQAEAALTPRRWRCGGRLLPGMGRTRRDGQGMVRAYVTFAGRMLALAADLLEASAPEEAALCARAADAAHRAPRGAHRSPRRLHRRGSA